MANGNYREKSVRQQMAEEGAFLCVHGNWGLKITSWFEMDRVKFSFIDERDKNNIGKGDSFDVCLNIYQPGAICFHDLCCEIMHDILRERPNMPGDFLNILTRFSFVSVMEGEKQNGDNRNSRYNFVTGDNGSKGVAIMNSSKKPGFYVISGRGISKNGNKANCMVPVSYSDLVNLARDFLEAYADREKEIKEIRLKAVAEADKYWKDRDNGQTQNNAKNQQPNDGYSGQNRPQNNNPGNQQQNRQQNGGNYSDQNASQRRQTNNQQSQYQSQRNQGQQPQNSQQAGQDSLRQNPYASNRGGYYSRQ